ncbi:hypothetical protein [Actinomadura parmotrematis]|uniref:Uncharacterized protein n=1 Tax=Actinomadura parmotrematis TaxID=2864039 RepID=A0ABS7G4B0_9ACTN|nr:hypothetical protein [Actinomadura parmotrematis]MBW8486699.1 hypothetical protein [Actinomadura parmotrematis]
MVARGGAAGRVLLRGLAAVDTGAGRMLGAVARQWRRVVVLVGVLLGLACMALALVPGGVQVARTGQVAPQTGGTGGGTGGGSGGADGGGPGPETIFYPTLTTGEIRKALTPGKAVGFTGGSSLRRWRLGFIVTAGVVGCGWNGWRVPGTLVETGNVSKRIPKGADAHDGYTVQAVAYSSGEQAGATWRALAGRAAKCPAKHSTPRAHISGTYYALENTQHWKILGRDSGPGWQSMRVRERVTYPDSRWRERAILTRVVDYLQVGNVLLVQLLHIWQEPGDMEEAVMRRAALILDRTLKRAGEPPCQWEAAADMACRIVAR